MRNNQPIISKFELTNFKCHLHLEEELNGITILAGENSAGKSSLIQSLLLFDSAVKSNGDSVFTLNVHGINLGKTSSIISESSGSENIYLSFFITDTFRRVNLSLKDNDDVSFNIKKIENNNTSLDEYKLFYINAERLGPRAYNNISSSDVFYVGTHGENTIYVIDQLDKLIRTKELQTNIDIQHLKNFSSDELSRFSSIVEQWLQTIIPGTSLIAKSDTEQGTAAIRYSNHIGTEVIPTATGFGITYVLPIIVQALISLMFPNSVLIIENPEAHLHPYSQSKLGRFLAKISSYGTQVIVETHSEHFINGCRLELAQLSMNDIANILFFSRNHETLELHHTNISIDESGELSIWPEGFFDQSELDLLEVVKNKCKQ